MAKNKLKKEQANPPQTDPRLPANEVMVNCLKEKGIIAIVDKVISVETQIPGVLYSMVERGRLIAKYKDELPAPENKPKVEIKN